jgi:hypothetical protein
LCRAGRLERAAELLEEMSEEPFMRAWPARPVAVPALAAVAAADDPHGGHAATVDTHKQVAAAAADAAAAAWAADAGVARKAAAERRAAAPAYTQTMHALCADGQPGAALQVHRRMVRWLSP